jgi:sugar phosphate isomerase/epimerase
VKKAEFYALMQMDDELLKGLRPLSPLPGQAHFSATHILAKLFEDGQPFKRLGILADRVAAQFNSRGVKVEALASFIPHLASLERSSREEAQNAVRCLWVLAKLLRDREHHIRSIELVAGSRLVGIISTVRRTPAVPARGIVISPDEHTILFAQRLRPELSCIRLLSALEESLTDICNEYPLPDVALSLECEPGPLFTANGTRALRQVVEAIDQYPALKNRLGFNVDIAHFALAGIHPSDLFSSGDIAQRISHFHISDHGWGHFGDAVIGHCGLLRGEADRLEVFKDWLRCACAYAKTRTGPTTGLVPFSGLVSVELEAAKSTELVRRSCEVLTELLAQAAGWHDPKPPL